MADVKVRIIAQDEASPPLDKIGKEAAKTKQAFAGLESGLLSVAAAFGLSNVIGMVANKFKSLITDSFQLAAGLEQAKIAFTTMLGSAEKSDAMLKELKAFADKTPFEFLELQDAAKRMMAYGFAAKDVIPTLEAVGNAAGALGGGGGQYAHLAAFHMIQEPGPFEHDLHQACDQIGMPLYPAYKGHMHEIRSGAYFEKLRYQMVAAANSQRCIEIFSWLRFHQREELLYGGGRQRVVHRDEKRRVHQ